MPRATLIFIISFHHHGSCNIPGYPSSGPRGCQVTTAQCTPTPHPSPSIPTGWVVANGNRTPNLSFNTSGSPADATSCVKGQVGGSIPTGNDPPSMNAVSYTQLDVYKRQASGARGGVARDVTVAATLVRSKHSGQHSFVFFSAT
ncbi:hypothetical protein DEO72_LG5g2180 [Vigna unguiculata]|uniref:Uncharacterized protein n=1 Tax=Vigna unguiculata TaxID=3917 RepID=A0A4D6M0N2_VIGUN|nr:hypothetical protein DEO72_LG5g2180 [Vigna unguiculata]